MDKKHLMHRTVLCGALLTGTSTGIFSNSAAVFIAPVCADLGFSRGSFALISSITLLSSMAALPFFAKLMPKAGPRRLIAACSFVCSSCVMTYSFCAEIWQFYITAAIYGLFVNGITLLSVGMLMRRLMLDVGGTVSGVAFAGAGILSFIFLPLLQRMTEAYGWRWGYRLQAAAGAVVLLTALLLMPKDNFQTIKSNRLSSFFSLLKHRGLLYIAFALFIANAVNLALFNHSAANLTAIGFSAAAAASVTSWAALFSSASKPLFGISMDKLGLRTGSIILSSALLLSSAAAILMPFNDSAVAAFPVLLSICACSNSIPANIFAARLFDKKDFSSAAAFLTFCSTAGSAVGPPLAGAVFDRIESYTYMWYGCAAAAVLSGFFLIFGINNLKGEY